MAANLPRDYQLPLGENMLKQLEYNFHSADYHLMNQVVTGLRTMIYLLLKATSGKENVADDELVSRNATEFVSLCYSQLTHEYNSLHMIGIKDASPSQIACLDELQMPVASGSFISGWKKGTMISVLYYFHSRSP